MLGMNSGDSGYLNSMLQHDTLYRMFLWYPNKVMHQDTFQRCWLVETSEAAPGWGKLFHWLQRLSDNIPSFGVGRARGVCTFQRMHLMDPVLAGLIST